MELRSSLFEVDLSASKIQKRLNPAISKTIDRIYVSRIKIFRADLYK